MCGAVLWAGAFKVWVCSNLGWYQSGIEMVGHLVAVGEMLLANTAANGIAVFPSPASEALRQWACTTPGALTGGMRKPCPLFVSSTGVTPSTEVLLSTEPAFEDGPRVPLLHTSWIFTSFDHSSFGLASRPVAALSPSFLQN